VLVTPRMGPARVNSERMNAKLALLFTSVQIQKEVDALPHVNKDSEMGYDMYLPEPYRTVEANLSH
jgi:hypothetical protein